MAGQLMLVNPRKRRRKAPRRNPVASGAPPKRRKRRNVFQKVGSAIAKTAKRARRSGARRGRKVGRAVGKALKGARRSKRKPQSIKALVGNPAGFVRSTVMPAAMGAAGALALDAAYAYLPIPTNLKNGPLAPLVKIGTVGVIGAAASHFAPQKSLKMVHTAVTASIIIIAYGFLKNRLQAALPSVRLGEFLDDDTGCPIPGVTPLSYTQAGVFMPELSEYVSEYVSGDDDIGEYYEMGDYSERGDYDE